MVYDILFSLVEDGFGCDRWRGAARRGAPFKFIHTTHTYTHTTHTHHPYKNKYPPGLFPGENPNIIFLTINLHSLEVR